MQAKPPAAIRRYMEEFEYTAPDLRDYILRQIDYYHATEDKAGATVEQWIGFKLDCTSAQARTAINWAKREAGA